MKERKDKVENKILIIGITLVLLAVGLSGCNGEYNPNPLETDIGGEDDSTVPEDEDTPPEDEDKDSTTVGDITVYGDIDEIEILNVEVSTQERAYAGSYGWRKAADGFVIPQFKCRYRVNGTAKNIAGKTMSSMKISINYLDAGGNALNSQISSWDVYYKPSFGCSFTDVLDGDTYDFEFTYEESGGRWSSNPFVKTNSCNLEVAAVFPDGT